MRMVNGFRLQTLLDIHFGGAKDYELISDDLVGSSRWALDYRMIFRRKSNSKYFAAHYSRGATEYQDIGLEFDTVYAVRPQMKTVTVYVKDEG